MPHKLNSNQTSACDAAFATPCSSQAPGDQDDAMAAEISKRLNDAYGNFRDLLRIQTIHPKAKRVLARSVDETIHCINELALHCLDGCAKDFAGYESRAKRFADMVENQRKGPAAKRDVSGSGTR